jgi:predicted regulator of Ras-like GTPase activity (Roadblock/LC7/MglB family)
VEPSEALAELMTLSSQIDEAAILGESGFVLASTGAPERGEQLARVATELLAAAAGVRADVEVTRVEVRQPSRSVFVVVEAGRTAVATTVPEPTAGLVLYDLRTALRRVDETPASKPKPKPKRKRSTSA